MEEGLIYSPNHPVKLPVFEGPLDLLLFLIRKNEIDIYDIPIETVTDQYLTVLRQLESLNLEVAGDFFVMAATLMYIKSRMLLPPKDQPAELEQGEEEDIDPRWDLVQQLLEYRKFKEAAVDLQELIDRAGMMLPRESRLPADALEDRPIKPTDKIELWNTFNHVLRRLTERITVGEIHDDSVTIADQMEVILERCKSGRPFTFSGILGDKPSVYHIVTTFLALLELARLSRVRLEQNAAFSEIHCHPLNENVT